MNLPRALLICSSMLLLGYGCSASSNEDDGTSGSAAQGTGGSGGGADCGTCFGLTFTPCDSNGNPGSPVECLGACIPGTGCSECLPGEVSCFGNDIRQCNEQGTGFTVIETCDAANNMVCSDGACVGGCQAADDQPSNVGCEFWAVDLDQQDGFGNDPASAPWGVALSNAGQAEATVTIEINEAAPGDPLNLVTVEQITVAPGTLQARVLPTRELDCGIMPNSYEAPGTCLSSRAFRIKSTAPIVVYQYNVFENTYSNDASLLLPTNALGNVYRVLGWIAGHPVPIPIGPLVVDRSAVTVVGTEPNTMVTIKPSWRIKGNPPIAATQAGGSIQVELGPFDVLNIETDDGTFQDDPKTVADLSGTLVQSTKPVAVFSSVETTSVPAGVVDIPTYSGWNDETCCLDHLEEQMFPVESVGTKYVITRSPIRSTGSYVEPDVLRFMGVAETANITTNLPAPFDNFTLQPGEVRTTWSQTDTVVTADKPVMVAQLLISQGYISGALTGDPSLTVFPPVEQYRTEYVILTPPDWDNNHIVISAEVGSEVLLDGNPTSGCVVTPAGDIDGKSYESRRCPVVEGVHGMSGAAPFGVVAYGYGSAGSYAFAGGADVKKIYEPPEIN